MLNANRRLVFVSVGSFVVIVVTCLARAASNFQPTKPLWSTFLNEGGWSNGIDFLTGLISPKHMYVRVDVEVHLAEDCKNLGVVVPRVLMSIVFIGSITSFVFAIIMMYCTSGSEAVVSTATG